MTVQHTTDAEIVTLLQAIASEGSVSKASAKVGIDEATGRRRVRLGRERGLTAESVVVDEAERLRIQVKQLQRDLDGAKREALTTEHVREKLFNLTARTPQPPRWIDPKKPDGSSRGVPMCLWSDWHYGEVVRPEEVGGTNEFNATIAEQRVRKLVDTTIDLAFNHMGTAEKNYPGVIVCLGGDMMTGNIHDELTETNDRTVQQQVNDLTDILASALERMADAFGRVFVPCVVGNHGRGTLKWRMKQRVYTSYEWLIYTALERHFRHDRRFVFLIPGETDAYFKVYGHRFLLTHGDSLGVKGGDGIIGAIGPIMRGSIKVGRSEAEIGRNIDTILMGHWHQMLWLPGAIVNGALKGYDEYARLALRAPYSRPSQALWFVHPQHGITAKWEVFLEPARSAEESNEWLTWQERKSA
jgi:predicted phosphodiesterase